MHYSALVSLNPNNARVRQNLGVSMSSEYYSITGIVTSAAAREMIN